MNAALMNHPHRFLFIDDEHVSRMHQLRRVVNSPTPHPENPILKPDHPWEQTSVTHYGNVLYDAEQQRFRFWYLAFPAVQDPPLTMEGISLRESRAILCYAESDDGIRWRKPSLGQVEFQGSRDNNILRIGRFNTEGAAILHEPDDPNPQRRYKALFWERDNIHARPDGLAIGSDGKLDGIWVAFSSDGLHWTNYAENPVVATYSDTSHYVVRDPRTQRYMAYGRFGLGRVISLIDSDDFLHWSRQRIVMEPDMVERAGPPPATQFYGMSVDLYEGLYVGGLWIYRPQTDGGIDTQLAVSRDGEHWQRVGDRQTFLPLGPSGAPDDGMVRSTANYIVRGDQIYIYYGMVNGPHVGPLFPQEKIVRKYPRTVGLGILRRDGFASLDAGNEEALLLTKPFWLDGQRDLHLNVNVASGGYASVSVCHWGTLDLTPAGDALEKFEQSVPIVGDQTNIVARWPETKLQSLSPRFVRLRIRLRNAKLYSYWLE